VTDSEGSSTAGCGLWCPCYRSELTGCRSQNSCTWTHCSAQGARQTVRTLHLSVKCL